MTPERLLSQRHATAGRVFQLATGEEGNDFAPNYYKYPESLALLLKAIVGLERKIKAFQRVQWDGIEQRFNLALISQLKFDQFDDLGIFVDFYWQQDEDNLAALFVQGLSDAIEAGGVMSQLELGFNIDFSPNDLPAVRYLEEHVPKLANSIALNTQKRIKHSIRKSLLAGEDRDQLVKRLEPIVKNTKRAESIAQTESIRAFSEGRIQAGIEMGATEKRWRAQIRRCPICDGLHGETVGITASFSTGHFGAPAHANCRCGVELSFGENRDTENIEQYRKDYIKGLRSRSW
jgi:SPP1 gp7 family putative phage head morphogenesis protein